MRREQSTAPGRERWAATRMRRPARALFVRGWKRKEFRARAYFCGKGERYFCFFFGFFGRRERKKRKGSAASPASQAILRKETKTGRFLVRFYSCIPKCYVLQIRNKAPSFSAPRCDAKSEARERTEENNAIVSASLSSSSSRWSAPWT